MIAYSLVRSPPKRSCRSAAANDSEIDGVAKCGFTNDVRNIPPANTDAELRSGVALHMFNLLSSGIDIEGLIIERGTYVGIDKQWDRVNQMNGRVKLGRQEGSAPDERQALLCALSMAHIMLRQSA